MTTVTTVGYGDLSPKSDTGRALAIAVMVLGIGFVAMLTAAAAEYFVRMGLREREGTEEDKLEIEDRLDLLAERLAGIERSVRELRLELQAGAASRESVSDRDPEQ